MKKLYIYYIIMIALFYIYIYSDMCKISQVDKFTQDLIPFYTISQRKQWNANYGYCGETSFITSLMYYGGYMSQYDMRELAMSLMTKKPKNQTVESSQLLLNSSMIYTKVADALHFSYEKYTGNSPDDFVQWIKKHTDNMIPVIIGVYESNAILEDKNSGDDTYDHIVSALSVNDNMVTICDNGLYTPDNIPQYIIDDIPIMTREDAYNNASIYAIPDTEPATLGNWGIAITGTKLPKECIRLQLTSDIIEEPEMEDGSSVPPKGEKMVITIHMYDLKPNVTYKLYSYDNIHTMPKDNFNTNYNTKKIGTLVQTFTAPLENDITDIINTSDTVIYRCVAEEQN
jgi:hypothetical protein